jgi:NitT/TauT family transport system permease protein
MKTNIWIKSAFWFFLLSLWEGLSLLRLWPAYIFPSPIDVSASIRDGLLDGSFIRAALSSLRRAIIGYGISVSVGVPLGFAIGRFRIARETVGSLVLGFQALPSICWLPLSLLWFGLSDRSIVFVVVMGALMAITISVADGVRNIPPIYIRAGKTLGARGLFLYTRVLFPASLPSIVSGFKLGWSFAWRSLMAGELLYVTTGLGQLLSAGRELNDMARVIAVMVLIIIMGLMIDKLVFVPAQAAIRDKWGTEDSSGRA